MCRTANAESHAPLRLFSHPCHVPSCHIARSNVTISLFASCMDASWGSVCSLLWIGALGLDPSRDKQWLFFFKRTRYTTAAIRQVQSKPANGLMTIRSITFVLPAPAWQRRQPPDRSLHEYCMYVCKRQPCHVSVRVWCHRNGNPFDMTSSTCNWLRHNSPSFLSV